MAVWHHHCNPLPTLVVSVNLPGLHFYCWVVIALPNSTGLISVPGIIRPPSILVMAYRGLESGNPQWSSPNTGMCRRSDLFTFPYGKGKDQPCPKRNLLGCWKIPLCNKKTRWGSELLNIVRWHVKYCTIIENVAQNLEYCLLLEDISQQCMKPFKGSIFPILSLKEIDVSLYW